MIECIHDCGAVHGGTVGRALADGWTETDAGDLCCGVCDRAKSAEVAQRRLRGPTRTPAPPPRSQTPAKPGKTEPPAPPPPTGPADSAPICVEYSDDLPEALKANLPQKTRRITQRETLVLRILAESGPLRIDAIMIGIYNGSGKIIKPAAAHKYISKLITRGLIIRPSYGQYALSDKGLAAHQAHRQAAGDREAHHG